MNQISIFILGDQAITREGLRALLHLGTNLNVIEEAGTVEDTLACAGTSRIDVVLVDLPLPICALDATRRLLSAAPSTRIIVLSRYANDPDIGKIVATELCQAGASALLPKNTSARELMSAIYQVITGDTVFPRENNTSSPRLAPAIDSADGVLHPSLTLRQTQVLKLVAEGLANKEIADRLSISAKTVEKHRQSVKEKLHTNNAADLARRAIGLGLVRPN